MERIGIDIGRVLICPTINGVNDTSVLGTRLEQAIQTPPAPNAIAVVRSLVERAEGRVWIVSKCGPSVQRKSLAWLDHIDFYERTGVRRDHVHFCLKRHEKLGPAKRFGMTHFIDDRVDVLRHLRGAVPNLLLFGEDHTTPPTWARPVRDWRAVAEAFGEPVPSA